METDLQRFSNVKGPECINTFAFDNMLIIAATFFKPAFLLPSSV